MFGLVVDSHVAELVQTKSGQMSMTTASRKLAEAAQLRWEGEARNHSLLRMPQRPV